MLVIEIVADKSFGVDISKYYENVAADANTGQMCHKCESCNNTFSDEEDLKLHMKVKHGMVELI